MVNVLKLKEKMVETETNVDLLATKIGVDRATLYRRLNSKGETFTIKEVNLIVEVLGLNLKDANAIFFSHIVA